MRIGSLFTGIGGIELGLRLAGVPVDLAWWAELNETLSVVRLPSADYDANLGDVTTINWSDLEEVDMITAGFPCQPVSSAGGKRFDGDPRWMWPFVYGALRHLRPKYVVVENVRNLVYADRCRLWDNLLNDLKVLGYGVRWLILGACHVGCAHHRHRVFLLGTHGEEGVTRVPTSFCGIKGKFEALPTPTANGYGNNQDGESVEGRIRPSLKELARTGNWDLYERAIAVHTKNYGPSPNMMEEGPLRRRLSVEFVEWLMCLPPGHVSGHLPRSMALQALGNAVCPPQMAEAWKLLTGS